MTHDLTSHKADSHVVAVADALIDHLHGGDEQAAWALVKSSDGRAFMTLLIRDGAGPPRILFGLHESGERSLPDRIVLDDLDRDTVARAISTAYGRAVRRRESVPGSLLQLVSTGTPTDGPRDAEIDRVATTRLHVGRSRAGMS